MSPNAINEGYVMFPKGFSIVPNSINVKPLSFDTLSEYARMFPEPKRYYIGLCANENISLSNGTYLVINVTANDPEIWYPCTWYGNPNDPKKLLLVQESLLNLIEEAVLAHMKTKSLVATIDRNYVLQLMVETAERQHNERKEKADRNRATDTSDSPGGEANKAYDNGVG